MTHRKVEQRASPRYSCNFLVTIKFLPNAEGSLRTPLNGECDSVSLGGALVLLPEPVALGSGVTVVFTTPAGDTAAETSPIETLATVVWVLQTLAGPPRYPHGLKFLQSQPDLLTRAWPGRLLSG
ncbi:MAG: PilZ domain-containing protein [Candidatus Methylomirabilales bacterium]